MVEPDNVQVGICMIITWCRPFGLKAGTLLLAWRLPCTAGIHCVLHVEAAGKRSA